MKTITLKRVSTSGPDGVFGVLIADNIPFAVTLERPWRDNQRQVSCIPDGSYACRRVSSPKFGDTFEVTGVENRSHVLFHKGNTVDDSQGCILIGEQFEPINGKPGIAMSGKGYGEFMEMLRGRDEFRLIIQWA